MNARRGRFATVDRGATRHRIALLALAAACLATFAVLYVAADRTMVGQRVDDWTFLVLFDLVPGGWPAKGLAWFARTFVVAGLATLVAILVLIALIHREWKPITRAVVLVAVPVLLTPYLRDDVLVRVPLQAEPFPLNSMPSTHAAAAAALTCAAVILWPARDPRPWWVDRVAAVLVVLLALGNVISQAHRPSDVAGSLLLVAAVAAVVECAFVGASAELDPAHARSSAQ